MPNEFKIKNGLLIESGGANITGNTKFNTSLLVIDSTNTRVGVNVTSPDATFHLDGNIKINNQATGTPANAPSGVGSPLVDYYGGISSGGTTYLSEPNAWLTIDLDGNTYFIPVYT